MPAVLTASTSRTSSCWPWSYSPRSRPVSRRPVPRMVTPSSSSRRSEGHSRSLGPRMSASRVGRPPPRAAPRARPGRGWRRRGGARPTRSRRPCSRPSVDGGRERGRRRAPRRPSPKACREQVGAVVLAAGVDGDDARQPASAAPRIPSITAGSQRAPSWLTRRAATEEFTVVDPNGRPRRTVSGGRRGVLQPHAGQLVVRPRASSACGARARTGRPRCRSARRSSSAYSRQSSRTSHVRQTFLASLVDPPFSGKNASGSVCAHSARSCHPASSASPSRRSSSLTALALSTRYWTSHPACPVARFPSRPARITAGPV